MSSENWEERALKAEAALDAARPLIEAAINKPPDWETSSDYKWAARMVEAAESYLAALALRESKGAK